MGGLARTTKVTMTWFVEDKYQAMFGLPGSRGFCKFKAPELTRSF